jgi:antitoxin MazE
MAVRNNIVKTGVAMQIAIRTIGNSKGVVLPKPLLAQAGLDGQDIADIAVENGSIVLRKPAQAPRVGWAEAAAALAEQGGDVLLLGEFGNAGDAELVW